MTHPKRYQKQATLGLIGLGLIASPLLFKLPFQFIAFNAGNQIETNESIERARIEQRKQTADKLKETGVLPNGQKLIIQDYYDTSRQDPNPNVKAFLKDETVFVYDSGGACIGKIQNRKWLWKHYYQGVCDNAPAS